VRSKNALLRALGAFGLALGTAWVPGCGGGGGDNNVSSAQVPNMPANQVVVAVASGLQGVPNLPTVSVTVCAPGTATCQTIDNIQVDTMSFGLRLVGTAASQVLSTLPVQTDGSGHQIAECAIFADGFTWGTIRTADVRIGGESASSVPINILGDMSLPPPASCTQNAPGGAENSVSALGVNGILGVGVTPYDCGSLCAMSAADSSYYACSGSACTQTAQPLASQVTNPVAKFAVDNNGVILAMPGVGQGGAVSVSGTLTFGIGTQSNNAVQGAQTFGTNAHGDISSTNFSGTVNSGLAFFDSGSNGYFFNDSSLVICPSPANGFFCPQTTTSRVATVSSASAPVASTTVTMTIANANSLFSGAATANFAFSNLAGPFGLPNFVDFGMPFFYGRTVYFGYDRQPLGGTQTPYVAF
jgi:hypothetical protein